MQKLRSRTAKIEGTVVPGAKPQRVVRVVGTDEAEMTAFLHANGYGEDEGDLVIMHRIVAPAHAHQPRVPPHLL